MGTIALSLDVLAGRPDTTSANVPELVYIAGSNFPADGYAFTSGGTKALYFKLGAELYGNSGNWTLELHWYSRSGSTTGNVNWVAALAAITPGDAQSVESKAFATSQNATTTVNGTAKGDTLTSITISNLDSVNAGDDVWLKITRGTDTMTGDAILVRGSVSYSDGNSGSAGSGDVVGPASATTTAFARFNGTTGKSIQNSAVSCDSSGNLTGLGTLNGLPIAFSAISVSTATSQPTTSLGDVTGVSVTIPAAGTYGFIAKIPIASTSTSATAGFSINASGGTISNVIQTQLFAVNGTSFNQSTSTTNNSAVSSVARTTATTVWTCELSGAFTCTTSGTVVLRAIASANTTYTCQIGTSLFVQKS